MSKVYHWKLDEAAGTTAADATGASNATLVNCDFGSNSVSSSFAGASGGLALNGTDEYAQASGSLTFPFSISVLLTNNELSKFAMALGLNNAPITSAGIGFLGSRPVLYAAAANYQYGAIDSVSEGEETHLLAVAPTKDAQDWLVYVNGSDVTTPSSRTGSTFTSDEFRIGFSYASGRNFNGSIFDVRLYDQALSGAEVLAVYQSLSTSSANAMPSDLDPSVLKPSLSDGTNLKPSITTSAYTGGTPSSASEVKPGLLDGESLNPSLSDGSGNLKPGLLK